ncbi:MAG: hypothetical protein ALECFALPRED_010283 [Alectoria fallacina]|uniref:Uncharacterized protein n=1 Tax=Alectoria fallacina TaxID=1903189 RepID=A0A8H3J9M7_9LECA|nr:MAG: hypothetical protein ALECFALPRED_010283 [Alectoria fallacina]
MTSTNLSMPHLPKEIRATILSHYDTKDPDLLHLWTSTRFVSLEFHQIIEDLFTRRHLNPVSIYFTNIYGIALWNTNTNKILYDWEGFGFLRLSANRQRAIFSSGRPMAESLLQKLPVSTKEMGTGTELIGLRHFVRVGGMINDTPLPGLVVDRERGTISIEWKRLFELFFAEEKLYRRLLTKPDSTKDVHPQVSPYSPLNPGNDPVHTSTSPTTGIVLAGDDTLQQAFPSFTRPLTAPLSLIGLAKRSARRARLCHCHTGQKIVMDGTYLAQESRALETLAEFQKSVKNGDWEWDWNKNVGEAGGEPRFVRRAVPMGRSRNWRYVVLGEGSSYETDRDEGVAESMEGDEKRENEEEENRHEIEEMMPATEGENSAGWLGSPD